MYQSILKNKSFKIVTCCIAAVLALFNIYIPKAFAAESVTTDAHVRAGLSLSVSKYATGNGELDAPVVATMVTIKRVKRH